MSPAADAVLLIAGRPVGGRPAEESIPLSADVDLDEVAAGLAGVECASRDSRVRVRRRFR